MSASGKITRCKRCKKRQNAKGRCINIKRANYVSITLSQDQEKRCKKRQNAKGRRINIKRANYVSITLSQDQENVQKYLTSEITIYRNLADTIQNKVYNSVHSLPSDVCLAECKEYIDYKLDKQYYDVKFARCEGQADTLRTCENIAGDLYSHPIYKCLRLLAPYTSFPCIAQMIYRFRYAAANAVSGRVHEAKVEAEKGMQKLQEFFDEASMARVNASCLYGYINVQLAGLALRPQKGQKEAILEWIEKGLEQVKVITESEVSNMWARMFLVKKAFHLLGIGLSGEDVSDPDIKEISCEDIATARQCLEEADQHWTNTDKRRRMLYKRAEAKLHLLGGDMMAACESLREAITLAHDFKPEEKTFKLILQRWIKRYPYIMK